MFPADLAFPLLPSLVVSRVATGTARVMDLFEVIRLMETSSAWLLDHTRQVMAARSSRAIRTKMVRMALMGSMVLLVEDVVLGQSLALW